MFPFIGLDISPVTVQQVSSAVPEISDKNSHYDYEAYKESVLGEWRRGSTNSYPRH
jgi:hypothetical protein